MKHILDIINSCQQKGIQLTVDESGTGLKLKGALKLLSAEDKEAITNHKPALIAFLQGAAQAIVTDIPALQVAEDYELSAAQRRLWVLSRYEGSNAAYNMNGVFEFNGVVDVAVLEQAFNVLIARHEILRTRFIERNGEVRQVVAPAVFSITQTDIRDRTDKEEYVRTQVEAELFRSFDLAADLLLRAAIWQLEEHRWIFSYTMHHIISDGWSMGVLIRELLTVYNDITQPLPPLPIQYKDFAAWQNARLAVAKVQDIQYWKTQLDGELPVLDLPGQYPRPAIKTFNGGVVKQLLPADQLAALQSLCEATGATLFMGLLALVNVVLHRYTSQEDIIVGCPVAGRDHADLEDQMGFYVNTLPVRSRFKGTAGFRQLLDSTKDVCLSAYEHQQLPFDELVDALSLPRDLSRNPVFDVWVVLHNIPATADLSQHFEVKEYTGLQKGISRYDLSFSFTETAAGLLTHIGYNSDIYTTRFVTALAAHLQTLLQAVTVAPDQPIAQLPMMSDTEIAPLLPTDITAIDNDTVVSLFEAQVTATPQVIAVTDGVISLTYDALNKQANQLAAYLRTVAGLQPGDIAGIRMQRGAKLIVAIMGILKSGAAYLPFEPEYPEDRVTFMRTDSRCKVLVDDALLEQVSGYPDTNLPLVNEPTDLAYVIYTSGSTGQPKGVMISHRALVDYFDGIVKATNITECHSFGHISTIAADLGNTILYSALLLGGTIHILPLSGITDQQLQLDCLKIVPSHWKSLQTGGGTFLPLKTLIFGGETLTSDVVTLAQPVPAIYNHYGPTETTIGKLISRVKDTPVTLGRVFGNNHVYILDQHQQLVPKGVRGEICIGGQGLAIGYLNRPELDAERFVPDPYRTGERIYRTGDMGVWTEDDEVRFLGRGDTQVKIRGFRIEPGEIESKLLQLPFITGAAVIVVGEELAAYITAEKTLEKSVVLKALEQQLPAYMVPAHLLQLEKIPLTTNGKIDRKALPAPGEPADTAVVEKQWPSTDTEKELAAIWADALGLPVENLGTNESFIQLGGHSLKAIKIMLKIHQRFQVKLSLDLFFEEVTISSLAIEIDNSLWARSTTKEGAGGKSVIL